MQRLHPTEKGILPTTRFFPLAAAQQNLKRLLVIRLIVFTCQFLALLYAWLILSLDLSYIAISTVMAVVVAVNAGVVLRLRKQVSISNQVFLYHLLFDIAALSMLLYLGGGASNPFVSFFLVPITISAAILPWKHTWLIAALSLLAYTVLLFFYQPLDVLMPEAMDPMSHDMEMANEEWGISLHILGMWFNFLVSAVLITYFVVQMAEAMRGQESLLNRYREENLRNEQILAVATQAAGTAHELGTPLNTMAILVTEMAQEYEGNEALGQDLRMLDTQLRACRQSLKELVSRADFKRNGSGQATDVTHFVEMIWDQWRLLRPEVTLDIQISSPGESPAILVDVTLQQAVMNILNNAADASPKKVELMASWDGSYWSLSVRDYGDGIRGELMANLGSGIISGKENGLGVGLMLTQASISRLGGQIDMHTHSQGGTVIEIRLPYDTRMAS
jgi:two-component system sensor histidine kinase RegB